MTNSDLINKIKVLKQIKPDKEWKESTRAFLLSECRETDLAPEQVRYGASAEQRLWIPVKLFRFKPVMAAALVVIFIIVGSAYSLNISKRSLPGDMFWNLKVSLEKAQVTFSSLEGKVKLETEFAGKRLEELKIVSLEEKPKAVAQAIENFKIHISEVKEGLKNLEEKVEPEKIAEVSKEVQEKLEEYARESDTETLAAISNPTDEITDEFEKELISRIEEKIENAKEILLSVQNDKLEEEIEKAEKLLKEGRLIEALDKILEVERIMGAEEVE